MDDSLFEDDDWADEALLAECEKAEEALILKAGSSLPPTTQHLKVLRQNFGHSNFKDLQWKIIRSVLEEAQDQCVVMATGYGKSLCYQVINDLCFSFTSTLELIVFLLFI